MKRKRLKWTGVAVLFVAALTGAAANGASPRMPGEDEKPKVVKTRDLPISKEDKVGMTVWHNGEYRQVAADVKRKVVEYDDGTVAEEVTLDAASMAAQLPPADPTKAHLRPTPEQIAAARAADGTMAKLPPAPRKR